MTAKELSPSLPSCNQDDVSLSSSTSSVDSKSQFTSDEESNPVIPQSSLLEDKKKLLLKSAPFNITTVEDAAKSLVFHMKNRWKEMLCPDQPTPAEKLALCFLGIFLPNISSDQPEEIYINTCSSKLAVEKKNSDVSVALTLFSEAGTNVKMKILFAIATGQEHFYFGRQQSYQNDY